MSVKCCFYLYVIMSITGNESFFLDREKATLFTTKYMSTNTTCLVK